MPGFVLAMCLACAGAALAADPVPRPDPLWNAYPLDIGGGATGKPPPSKAATTVPAPTPSVRLDQQPQQDGLVAGAILLYATIAGIVVCVAYAARRQMRLRRTARSPTGAVRG